MGLDTESPANVSDCPVQPAAGHMGSGGLGDKGKDKVAVLMAHGWQDEGHSPRGLQLELGLAGRAGEPVVTHGSQVT